MREVLPLDKLDEGEKGKVVDIVGGKGFRMRLVQLGIIPGVEVKIAKSAVLGCPLMVEVNNARIALGRGVASRIWVEKIE
ncbi:MAG: ferrous iron transport protein A [Synergistetes bacterium]|nr:MAG: Iron(II) transport protein A [bacterium 42_11]MBC7330935.1 ferrous iron transport protein A [Synergistota bacterium]MDK2870896.1 ferrous iron transport protein [bacterium]